MKASELIAALQAHMVNNGDVDVTISVSATGAQGYTIADAIYVVAEQYEDHTEVMIRDWPY